MQGKRTWSLLIPVGANLLLGIPAVIPLFLTEYVLVNGPLADLGWTQREPTENDGMLGWLIFLIPAYCVVGPSWALINVWMRRRTAARTACPPMSRT